MKSIRSIVHYLKFDKWNLAFTEETLDNIVKSKSIEVNFMKGNNNKQWFADPFILDVTHDYIICLVEDFSYKTMKGRISKLTIDRRSYKLKEIKILLDLPTHLSFPFIFRQNGEIYIMPENSASGKLTIYTYNSLDDELIPHNIVAERPLTDSTIYIEGNKSYLFTTQEPTSNGNIIDIYEFDMNAYTIGNNPIQSIAFDNNKARNAGAFFMINNKIFRPAQDCNGGYGRGIILQELKRTSNGFVLNDYCSFYPHSWIYNKGYHTLNSYKGVTVIDARGYRYVIGGRILQWGTNIVKSIIRLTTRSKC